MGIALTEWKEAIKNGDEINTLMEKLSKDDRKQMDVRIQLLAIEKSNPHFDNLLTFSSETRHWKPSGAWCKPIWLNIDIN